MPRKPYKVKTKPFSVDAQDPIELFSFVDINLPGVSREAEQKVEKMYFGTYGGNEDKDITPEFRTFLRKTFKISAKSKDVSNIFGDGWTLGIDLLPTNSDKISKILTIDHGDFTNYINNGLVPQARRIRKIMMDIEMGIDKQAGAANELNDFLANDQVTKLMAKGDIETLETVFSEVSSKSKDRATLLKAVSKPNAIDVVAKLTKLQFSGTKETKMQAILVANKDFVFFNDSFVDDELDLSMYLTGKDDSKKKADIVIIDEFGIPKIIELKKSDFILLNWDNSHNKFTPRKELSSAISQLSNYLRIMAKNSEDISTRYPALDEDYIPIAQGLVIIGDSNNLFNYTEQLKNKMVQKKWSKEDVEKMAKVELSMISYNLKNINVICFDQYVKNVANRFEVEYTESEDKKTY